MGRGIRRFDPVAGAAVLSVFAAAGIMYISFVRTAASTEKQNAWFATIEVTNGNDSGPGSLREAVAIANSSPGDEIIVDLLPPATTITLTSGPIEITTSVSIRPITPDRLVRISGNNNSRTFTIPGGAAVSLSNVTITQGAGGVLPGGAILVNGGSLTLDTVILENNRSTTTGGAIAATGGTVTATNCRFANNMANGGGGALVAGPTVNVTITGSTFEANSATGNPVPGGAAWFQGGNTTLKNSNFIANVADDGSALLVSDGTLLLEGNTFRGNIARRTGTVFTFGNLDSKVDTFTGNSSAVGGNAIHNAGPGTLTVNGTTIAGNNSSQSPGFEGASTGAIRAAGGTSTLQNVLLAENNGPDLSGTFASQGFNFIQNPGSAVITGNTATNITGQNPMLGPLQNNGGPTQTRALLPGSPAIDKGFSPPGVTTDQRGLPRPVDNPGIPNAAGGNGTDIGSFEVQAGTPTPTPTPTPSPTPGGGLEGDLAPRPTGDGEFRANDLAALQLFFAGTPFTQGANEFQRADGAPYETQGDGRLTAADVQLMRNYIAQLAVPQAAGGPTEPVVAPFLDAELALEPNGRNERNHRSSWIWSKPVLPFIVLR